MGHARRSFAAVLAGLALVAMLPVPCPCPEPAAAAPMEHACCAPPAGISANDHGCCDAHDRASADFLTPASVPAAAPAGVAVARLDAVVRLVAAPRGFAVPSPFPPPAILRI